MKFSKIMLGAIAIASIFTASHMMAAEGDVNILVKNETATKLIFPDVVGPRRAYTPAQRMSQYESRIVAPGRPIWLTLRKQRDGSYKSVFLRDIAKIDNPLESINIEERGPSYTPSGNTPRVALVVKDDPSKPGQLIAEAAKVTSK